MVARERCEDDARGYFAAITDAGREKLESARPTHWGGIREHFLGRLTPDDLDALAHAWTRVQTGSNSA
jgi:DNA-binding MarR family transcriptional regulator